MRNNTSYSGGGLGLPSVLTIIFVVLKLVGVERPGGLKSEGR